MDPAARAAAPRWMSISAIGLILALLAGCDDTASGGDAGMPPAADAGFDMSRPPLDGSPVDARPPVDAQPPVDGAGSDGAADADADGPPDAGPPPCGPMLRFDPTGAHWLDTPWPSDRRLTAAGGPDLDDTPLPDNGLLRPYRAVAATLDGFGLNGAAYARFDGPLAPDRLPSPAETLVEDAAVQLRVMTGPQAGRVLPLELGVPAADDAWVDRRTLLARPVPGFVLPEAAVVCVTYTDVLIGADGCPARAAPAFEAALAGDPSLAALGPAAARPPGLIGATCFTTRHATDRLDAVLAHARAEPEPTVRIVSEDLRGNPPRRTLRLIYDAPVYQSGEAPWSVAGTGGLTFDADGRPIARRVETAALLALPDVDPPEGGFPVVQYASGTGGPMTVCPSILRQAYASGHAVACVDRPGLGERGDGTEPPWPDFRNPFASLGTMAQEVTDHLTLSRVLAAVAAGRIEPVPGSPAPPALSAGKPALLGFSQGALMSGVAAGLLTEIDAVLIDSGGGLAIEGALLRPDSAELVGLFAPVLGIDPANLDGRHPAVAVLQLLADEVDPINYAPHWFGEGLPDVLILSGTEDTKTLTTFANALAAAAGVPLAEPILQDSSAHHLLGLDPVVLPVRANRGGRTAALIQAEAGHGLRSVAGESMDHWLTTRLDGPPEAR